MVKHSTDGVSTNSADLMGWGNMKMEKSVGLTSTERLCWLVLFDYIRSAAR